jgi:hypothetical protein
LEKQFTPHHVCEEKQKNKKNLIFHKDLFRSAMTYACPAWEFSAETHLLKLQRLQNGVLRTIGNFPTYTSVRDMHVVFLISVRLRLNNKIVQKTSINHYKSWKWKCTQYWTTRNPTQKI